MKRLHLSLALTCCLQWAASYAQENASQTIATLAASCAACHGPIGNSLGGTPTLAALNKTYFIQRMQGFKSGSLPSTVMHHHAKGLTDDEITALAGYFAALPIRAPAPAPQQSFLGEQ
ncbi:c-type cytochrome [Methylophilus sp.]|uniref:c-type cytochrome n=1 Tax=Methylophilus sp. TaxID=29541 RepID=UPI003FA1184E